MLRADDELIYTARKDIKVIVSFQVEKDGVGLRGVNMQEIMKYGHSWQKIYSMFLHIGCIFLSHCEGIRKFSLEVVQLKDEPCMLTVALSFVRQRKELLERNTNEIRMSTGITSAINGTH